MKARLEAFRRKKQKEEMIEFLKSSAKNVLSWNGNSNTTLQELRDDMSNKKAKLLCQYTEMPNQRNALKENIGNVEIAEDDIHCSEYETNNTNCSFLTKIVYLLYFVLWAMLYIIAIEIEFGSVYFVVSILVLICLNTRSGPKRDSEPSAYSVFNPNCEAIEGTLSASQFEQEIRYGALNIH